jgi:hypothetical protein
MSKSHFRRNQNILFLRGVKEDDLKADEAIFDNKFLDNGTSGNCGLTATYDTIPKQYHDMATWPKNTNLLCWECTCRFSGVPIFVPKYIYLAHDQSGRRIMDTEGNFCSFSCARSFTDKHYSGQTHDNRVRYLQILAQEFLDRPISFIPPGPDRTIMRKFCGPDGLTEADYQILINTKYF